MVNPPPPPPTTHTLCLRTCDVLVRSLALFASLRHVCSASHEFECDVVMDVPELQKDYRRLSQLPSAFHRMFTEAVYLCEFACLHCSYACRCAGAGVGTIALFTWARAAPRWNPYADSPVPTFWPMERSNGCHCADVPVQSNVQTSHVGLLAAANRDCEPATREQTQSERPNTVRGPNVTPHISGLWTINLMLEVKTMSTCTTYTWSMQQCTDTVLSTALFGHSDGRGEAWWSICGAARPPPPVLSGSQSPWEAAFFFSPHNGADGSSTARWVLQ